MLKNLAIIRNRRSIRLSGFDYGKPGFYFVTICTKERVCDLGEIEDGEIILSKIGECVLECIKAIPHHAIPHHFPHTRVDEFVIMPNHVHYIIEILYNANAPEIDFVNFVRVQNFEPLQNLQNQFQKIIPKSLGSIVRGFKIGVRNWCNENNFGYFRWHRNFYDRIIRTENELINVHNYIKHNIANWQKDIENNGIYQNISEGKRNKYIDDIVK